MKFEEFFSTIYKDRVFEVLKKYPDERSLTIDYYDLEMFDQDLADLLIGKPDEVIASSQRSIRNIDPLMKDAELNIRFKNFSNNIPLLEVSSRYMGNLISTEGIIKSVNKARPRIKKALFECRGCMKLHEVEQRSSKLIAQPSLCSECGGRSFRLLQSESEYVDTQKCILTNFKQDLGERDEPVSLPVILEDDIVKKLLVNDNVRLTGILKAFENKKGDFENYLLVNNIEYLEKDIEPIFETSNQEVEDSVSRSSPEYLRWRKDVFKRDKVCQCCGLDKRLRAHHIYGYEEHPELAYETSNGIILCQFCHDKYHSVYGLKNINPVKFAKFIRRFGTYGKVE